MWRNDHSDLPLITEPIPPPILSRQTRTPSTGSQAWWRLSALHVDSQTRVRVEHCGVGAHARPKEVCHGSHKEGLAKQNLTAGVLVLLLWPGVVAVLWDLPPILVMSMIWLGVVSVVFALFLGLPIALGKSGEAVLAQLEKRVDESALGQLRTQGEMFVLAQKIGAYLHGPLRSQFLQLSMELRSALEKADPFDVANALSRLRQVVNGLEDRVEVSPDVKEFLTNWQALITIDTNIDEIHIPERIRQDVTTVVTEAVNNTIRHGNAKRVGVFFRYRPEGLLVEVVGAPVGSDTKSGTGLGGHIFDDIAPGMWFSDVTEDGRYRLRVTLKTTV